MGRLMLAGIDGPRAGRLAGIRAHLVRHWPVWLLVTVGLALLPIIGNDFGPSSDEPPNAWIGAAALQAYRGGSEYFSLPAQADHGPFFLMVYAAGSRALGGVLPTWHLVDRRHVMNALSFLFGVVALYVVSLKYLERRSASVITWLFGTQPLLLGNGFINQKDIPFMSFFSASIALGMLAVDRWSRPAMPVGGSAEEPSVKPRHLSLRIAAACVFTVFIGVWIADWWWLGWSAQAMQGTVARLYTGATGGWLRALFLAIASDAWKTPLAAYQAKLDSLLSWLRLLVIPVWLAAGFGIWAWADHRARKLVRGFLHGRYPLLIMAGICLGCTISIRQYAALAGLIVGGLLLVKARWKAIQPLVTYAIASALATYATWPYLWKDPVTRLLGSVGRATGYPFATTLFRGVTYRSESLPWDYIPGLAAVELTEPAVLLFVLGCVAMVWKIRNQRGDAVEHLALLTWLILPPIVIRVTGATIYDNLRHVLFLMPPIFIVVGFGVEWLMAHLRATWLRCAAIAMMLLPGLVAIPRLHPYEYSYFNSFAGGLAGASRMYYLDPWCTSLRGAVASLNGIAPPGARVAFSAASDLAVPFLREDLNRIKFDRRADALFIVTCKRQLFKDYEREGFTVREEIARDGGVLARIYERSPGE